ncbi:MULTISPECIES: DUF397 domain-containing protein [Streptomyces]|nr:DUF397 domain-containing protein [Streptomyces ruber]
MARGTRWHKSSFSGDEDAPNCIEPAVRQDAFLLRGSDEPGTVLTTAPTGLAALIRHLRRTP